MVLCAVEVVLFYLSGREESDAGEGMNVNHCYIVWDNRK